MKEEKSSIFRINSLKYLLDKIKGNEFDEIVEDWKWIFSYSARYKWQIFVFTFFGVLTIVFGLGSSVANKYMVDIVTGHKTELLWLMVVIWLSTNVISLVFTAINNRFSARVMIGIGRAIKIDVFNHILDADWRALGRYTSGDMLNRINEDANDVGGKAITWLPNILTGLFNLVATFVVIWHYSKGMAMIAVFSAPFLFYIGRIFMPKMREYQRKGREMVSDIQTYETEAFTRIDTVKSMGIAELFMDRFYEQQQEVKAFRLEENAFYIKKMVVNRTMNMIIEGVAFAYGLWLLWTGEITYGTMLLFLQQRSRLTQSMLDLGGVMPNFVNGSVAAHRVKEVMEMPREKHDEESEAPVPEGGLSLVMKDIEFSYDENDSVIERGDIRVDPGEIIAIVGQSGRGKTTLLRMILALIHPDSGECELYDREGNRYGINADSRGLFSYVPQGNSLFSGTIADNLRLMNTEATDDELREALEAVDAWEFVEKMPAGTETEMKENGRGLSEGQAQRIAIARALLRKAPILILDEATSALDMETEDHLLENLKEHVGTRSIIVTTHRPSVLEMCDRVYHVRDGVVDEVE